VSFLSATLPGSVHDKTLADHADLHYPKDTTLRSDLGFLGYGPMVREHLQPKKSPDAGTDAGREAHQPQTRAAAVRAEHAMAGIKICRITKDVFRNLAEGLSDRVMNIATGLHNLRRAVTLPEQMLQRLF
jgi:hypothetical protein